MSGDVAAMLLLIASTSAPAVAKINFILRWLDAARQHNGFNETKLNHSSGGRKWSAG
jgi:hypothetical protein